MKLCLQGSIAEYKKGLEQIASVLDVELCESGIPIKVTVGEKFSVKYQKGKGEICAANRVQFFRGIGLLCEYAQKSQDLEQTSQPVFEKLAASFDMSRNGVLTVDTLKKLLCRMALMGYTQVMLYTEETYEVEKYPFFGYMRGRYTHSELKLLDDYAYALGIELVPCIQTLGHLERFLHWQSSAEYRDTNDVLLAGDDKTYALIDAMFASARECYRTDKIHVGMDEAMSLGLGAYLSHNGYESSFDIMQKHIKRVCDIAQKYGFVPMMWSDMYFRCASKTHDYYEDDIEIPQNVIDAAPQQMELVYWDYYHGDKAFYDHYIQMHQKFAANTWFAGGMWTWLGPAIDYDVFFKTSLPALQACVGNGIKDVMITRTSIKRNLNKEIHPGTKPSIDFIYKILEDAYASDLNYDVTDMRNAVLAFAASSTHQADYCIKLVNKMQFKSDDQSSGHKNDDAKLIFYDVEVFPNLFLVNWKIEGEGKPVVRMINPTPTEIEELMRFRLVGFNCRRYDNHILYARLMGYSNEQLYNLSMKIINGSANCFFGEAYNVSYTDVYDFSSKKQSLKKFEIELGIHHQELGLPWDKPVPEELWTKVAEYCDNDVLATEATFKARKSDFLARQILADVAGMSVNDTTNTLTTRIIFGSNRKPQDQFNYRNMGEASVIFDPNEDLPFRLDDFDEYTAFDKSKRPVFPGYKFEMGKSTYRGEEVGEGGYVYSEPGMYGNVALLDIASMHPSSIVAEKLFGNEYTQRFKDILDARIAIKHQDFEKARKMLNGALEKYLTDENAASDLASALKIAINSVYGLTSASFENPFHDQRNKDNIVAKRGALFMINLKHEVQKRGFVVAHVKTDSIKIPDATPEIIQFVTDYGQMYGYNFEHEDTYDKLCLVNDAVYIAKYQTPHKDKETGADIWWTATGTQFKVPYVFKKLFSKDEILFKDMCESKSVKSAIYIDRSPDEAAIYINTPDVEKEGSDNIVLDNDHSLHFIGKVGLFTPVQEGVGGGSLVRQSIDKDGTVKYDSVTGTKDYLWMESEMVTVLGKEDYIDRTYYNKMVDEAVKAINNWGDFEWFASEDPYDKYNNGILPF